MSEEKNQALTNAILRFFLKFLLIMAASGAAFMGCAEKLGAAPAMQRSFAGVSSWAQPLIASGTALPSLPNGSYTTGDLFLKYDTASGTMYRASGSAWLPLLGGSSGVSASDTEDAKTLQGVALSAEAPASGQALIFNGTEWTPLDVVGGSGDATSLQGNLVATDSPSDGQLLTWDEDSESWKPKDSPVGEGGSTLATGVFTDWLVCAATAEDFYEFAEYQLSFFCGGPAILGDALKIGESGVCTEWEEYYGDFRGVDGTQVSQGNIAIQFLASGPSSIPIYTCVEIYATCSVKLAVDHSLNCVGILENPRNLDYELTEVGVGSLCWVITHGVCPVLASGSFAPGDLLKVSNNGAVEHAADPTTIAEYRQIVGRAVTAPLVTGYALIFVGSK